MGIWNHLWGVPPICRHPCRSHDSPRGHGRKEGKSDGAGGMPVLKEWAGEDQEGVTSEVAGQPGVRPWREEGCRARQQFLESRTKGCLGEGIIA